MVDGASILCAKRVSVRDKRSCCQRPSCLDQPESKSKCVHSVLVANQKSVIAESKMLLSSSWNNLKSVFSKCFDEDIAVKEKSVSSDCSSEDHHK